jgi:hypothetical protein
LLSRRREHNASGKRLAEVVISEDGDSLTCKGLLLGIIDKFHQLLDWKTSSEKDLPKYFRNVVNFLNNIEDNLPKLFLECDSSVDYLKIMYDILFDAVDSNAACMIISEEDFLDYCTSLDNYYDMVYFHDSSPEPEAGESSSGSNVSDDVQNDNSMADTTTESTMDSKEKVPLGPIRIIRGELSMTNPLTPPPLPFLRAPRQLSRLASRRSDIAR